MEQEPWYCLFRSDAGPMAVPVESVAAVLGPGALVRLAWSPPQVVGLCPYHREVVPVVVLGPPPRGDGTRLPTGPDPMPAAEADPPGGPPGLDDRVRCAVLILKTEQGAWGMRVDPRGTILSRECPEFHPPRVDGGGPVLAGTIRHEGTPYGLLDTEATWRGLRAAVGRWYGLIDESQLSAPMPPGAEPHGAESGPSGENGAA